MSSSQLYFYFTEAVNATKMYLQSYTIQTSRSSAAITFKFDTPQLMQPYPSGALGSNVANYYITLTQHDINRLKFLARDNSLLETFNNFFASSFITAVYGATNSVFQGEFISIAVLLYK